MQVNAADIPYLAGMAGAYAVIIWAGLKLSKSARKKDRGPYK